MLHMASHTGV
ncbi:hypothetical protein F383_18329 [Gossypium arboreum]|uniref:Uncharacterized protein n=1 Tax=Gossypium arboreum TaxID=29729 RepID=A0A0B0NGT2_GOSAR|nr:hypothetical protein F383_18329 [Gossypium arboreum]